MSHPRAWVSALPVKLASLQAPADHENPSLEGSEARSRKSRKSRMTDMRGAAGVGTSTGPAICHARFAHFPRETPSAFGSQGRGTNDSVQSRQLGSQSPREVLKRK